MNFCPECGIKLFDSDQRVRRCANGHAFPSPEKPCLEIEVIGKAEVGPAKPTRQLPTNDEEREMAYVSALENMTKFFVASGFESYVSTNGTLMVGKGKLLLDAKILENDNRSAYVTSNPNYNPAKAGTKDSKATIITTRQMMKSKKLLRVCVNGGGQTVPIYVELRKNIADPELHICKAVMFILEACLDGDNPLSKQIKDRNHLLGVPAEWLPSAGDYDQLFGLHDASLMEPGQ